MRSTWSHAAIARPETAPAYAVHDLGPPRPGKPGYLAKVRPARRLISTLRPDVVHAHYATSYGLLGLASGVHPLVVSAHGDDVLISPGNPLMRRAGQARAALGRRDHGPRRARPSSRSRACSAGRPARFTASSTGSRPSGWPALARELRGAEQAPSLAEDRERPSAARSLPDRPPAQRTRGAPSAAGWTAPATSSERAPGGRGSSGCATSWA